MGKKEKKEEPEVEGHEGKIYFNSAAPLLASPRHPYGQRLQRDLCSGDIGLSFGEVRGGYVTGR